MYFETNNYKRKKFANENSMKIYVNEVDYLIEGVDYSMNKVCIFRIDSQNWKQPPNKLFEKINGFTRGNSNNKNNSKIENVGKNFYGEILIKTKFIKNAKLIIMESNISFFNNTNHSIRLAFVKSSLLANKQLNSNDYNNENNQKIINDNNHIDNVKNNTIKDNNNNKNINSNSRNIIALAETIIECKIRNNNRIPLKYIFHNYEVYMSLVFKKAKKHHDVSHNKIFISNLLNTEYEYQEVFRLFSTSLKYIYVLGIDYVNMELQNLKNAKKENCLKELNEKYCTLLSFEPELLENEIPALQKVIISSDILLLKSDDDITYAGDIVDLKDKSELLEAKEKSYDFRIVLNPPVIVSNKTPKEFVLNLSAGKETVKSDEPLSKFILKPLDYFHSYLFDMFENSKTSQIGFKSDANFNTVDFNSHAFDFKVTDSQKSRLRISNVENKDDFVDLIIETEVNHVDRIYEPNFYTEECFFSKSRIVNLYFEILVINRLEKHIAFNPLAKCFADEAKSHENLNKIKNDAKFISNDNKKEGKVLEVRNADKNLVVNEEQKKYEYDNNRNSNNNNYKYLLNQNDGNQKYKNYLDHPDNYSKGDLDFFSMHRKSYIIRTGEIGGFSIMDPNVLAKIKIRNSAFSNDFDFVYDSLNKIPSFENTDKQYEFHCLIRSSYTFNFSKILILEPRYYLLNKTRLNLKYREVHFKELKNSNTNNTSNNLNAKSKVLNDKVYSNKINELKPEEEKIFLLENRNYSEKRKKNLTKKDIEIERKRKETINSNNIHEFNFLQLFIDEDFKYEENAQANDGVIEKDDDLKNVIDGEENKNEAEIKANENNIDCKNKNNYNKNELNNLEIINEDQLQKWTSIINIDIDQDIDFKLEISKKFFLFCEEKIKQTEELLGNNNPAGIDQAQLKKMRQIITLKNNLFSYDNETFYILLRMTSRKYDNGLRYLIISEPDFPDLILDNTTEYDIVINQLSSVEKVIVPKNTEKIITLSEIHDLKNENISTIEVEIKELSIKSKINLKKIHDLTKLEANKQKNTQKKLNQNNEGVKGSEYFWYIDTENSNITRVIKIFEKNKNGQKSDFYISDKLKNQSSSYNFDCKLKGIGISFLNMSSQEYFYISFYKIKLHSWNSLIKSLNYINDKADITLKIYNIQVDYCKENLLSKKKIDRMYKNNYQTALKPKSQFTPYQEINIVKESFFPFFYLSVVKNTFSCSKTTQKTDKITQIKLNLGEFDLTIDQNMLSSLLEILLEFTDEIDFNKKKTDKKERDSAVDDLQQHHLRSESKEENAANVNLNVNNKQSKPSLPQNEVSNKTDKSSGYRLKGSVRNRNLEFFSEEYLRTVLVSAEQKLIEINKDSIFYIENLAIYPIIFNVDTKVDISSIKLSALPQSVQNLIGFFANSLTNLSDLNICFDKVEIEDLYDRMNNIIFDEDKQLREKYGKEAHRKLNSFFKITLEKGFDSVDKIIRNTLHLKT